MNAGPPEEGEPEVPPYAGAEEPQAPQPEPAVLPAEAPIYEQPAPYAYAPPPGAYAPAPRPPRSMAPLVAIIVAAIIVVVAVVAYAGIGFAYAQGRLTSSRDAYNTVIDHSNNLTDAMNKLGTKITLANLASASAADLDTAQTSATQLVTQSQAAVPQIESDDAALAKADSDLKQNQWLTAISRSDLEKMSTRIGHMRKALADAKTITSGYVQLGNFYQYMYAVALDFDAVGTQYGNSNFTGVATALDKLKTDSAKAMSFDKAPGVPAEADTYLKTAVTFANDLDKLLNAQDSAAVSAAEAAAQADANKLDSTDFNQMQNAIDSFYQPFIDDFNAERNKANNT